MTVSVHTTPEADEQAIEIMVWWRRNRPAAPYLFEDELDDAFDLIAEHPEIGRPFPLPSAPEMRRFVLRRTAYYVFYTYEEANAKVWIHAVWSAKRKRGPPLPSR